MIVFSVPRTMRLAAALAAQADLREGRAVLERFANGELHAAVETSAVGRHCVLVGAVAPPDEDLLGTSLLAHTLVKEGAARLTAVVPYLGYARHDKREPGKSLGTAWLGRLLYASGVQDVVTVDVHSERVHDLFPVPVVSLSPAELFAARLAPAGDDVVVVAPDDGAVARAEAVRRAAGIARPLVHFTKHRTADGVMHSALEGDVAPRAVIVDDILDTGGTLVSACEGLLRAGVREIEVMVTHGLFTGTGWRRLASLGVTRIVCTDTTPPPAHAGPVAVLSVVALLASHVKARATAMAV